MVIEGTEVTAGSEGAGWEGAGSEGASRGDADPYGSGPEDGAASERCAAFDGRYVVSVVAQLLTFVIPTVAVDVASLLLC